LGHDTHVVTGIDPVPGQIEFAFTEFRRVLRPGGRVLTYQMFGTDRLEAREACGTYTP
jgi:ubiquinone/menaquinone biosynthesis C-methylase UbiE